MTDFLARVAADPGLYVQGFLFYALATVLLFSAVMVITVRNAVHAVLFLILAFFNAAGLFLLLGAEFVAMILLIVYVGAVAVLFLFVVMMLDIDFRSLTRGWRTYLPIGLIVGALLFTELLMLALGWPMVPPTAPDGDVVAMVPALSNTRQLGNVLYTDFLLPFQLAGLVLLVAMIGAIVLTHRESVPGLRRQKTADQIARRPEDVLTVQKVASGQGVET